MITCSFVICTERLISIKNEHINVQNMYIILDVIKLLEQ